MPEDVHVHLPVVWLTTVFVPLFTAQLSRAVDPGPPQSMKVPSKITDAHLLAGVRTGLLPSSEQSLNLRE